MRTNLLQKRPLIWGLHKHSPETASQELLIAPPMSHPHHLHPMRLSVVEFLSFIIYIY